MNAFQEFNPLRKNTKTSTFSDEEEATLNWFKSDRDKNVPVSDSLLATKAEAFVYSKFFKYPVAGLKSSKIEELTGES